MSNIPVSSIFMIWTATSLLLFFMIFGTTNTGGFEIIGVPYLIFISCLIHGIFMFWIFILCFNKLSSETS